MQCYILRLTDENIPSYFLMGLVGKQALWPPSYRTPVSWFVILLEEGPMYMDIVILFVPTKSAGGQMGVIFEEC